MSLFSVIIPTYGRTQCLYDTLLDLDKQNFLDFDVYVVDQNDEIILDNLKKYLKNVELYHIKMPKLGSHAGRNEAIYKTNSKICVFLDDDVRIESDFLNNVYNAWTNVEENIGVIAGRVEQPKDNLTLEEMKKNFKRATYSSFTGIVRGNFFGFSPCFVDHIHECNFSAKTFLLKEVKGFNESFQGNAYFEGTDLAQRIIKRGYKIYFEPKITLIHLQDGRGGNRVQDKVRHTYWLVRNQMLLNALHMKRIGFLFFSFYVVFYNVLKSIKNKNFKILIAAMKGYFFGLRYFLNKNLCFYNHLENYK
jgi:GT2 family glycosyltransferase